MWAPPFVKQNATFGRVRSSTALWTRPTTLGTATLSPHGYETVPDADTYSVPFESALAM